MHSPLPWKVVRSETPYYTWLMDAEGGMVAIGFSKTDESLLLHAPVYRHAIEAALVALGAGRIVKAREILAAVLDAR
jgi:hypothetical protein